MGQLHIPDDIIKKRYLFDGQIETLAVRTAKWVCRNKNVIQYESNFIDIIKQLKFFPAGNTLVAGLQPLQPNCSILGPINEQNFDLLAERASNLWRNRIGIGFDLSSSADPVSLLIKLSEINKKINLWDGRAQRGNIATLSINHPKLTEFINCKSQSQAQADQLYNFNISVAIDNEFMDNLIQINENSQQDLNQNQNLIQENKQKLMSISANAWAYGDPGLVFIDRCQSPHSEEAGSIVTAVPCGEQFMHNNETCNLGSINLDAFIKDNDKGPYFDFPDYIATIKLATRFLDAIIDLLEIPDSQMLQKTLELRRIGLGVMGLATALQSLNISYQSEEALIFSDQLAHLLTSTALETSQKIASEVGAGYKYNSSRRNITVTCIAPTGGIRRLVNNDGYAIEPLFTDIIDPFFAVRMVSVWQKHIENSISKTVNLTNDTNPQTIFNIYLYAYQMGCKGITVYRDGCRTNQPSHNMNISAIPDNPGKFKTCDGDSCY